MQKKQPCFREFSNIKQLVMKTKVNSECNCEGDVNVVKLCRPRHALKCWEQSNAQYQTTSHVMWWKIHDICKVVAYVMHPYWSVHKFSSSLAWVGWAVCKQNDEKIFVFKLTHASFGNIKHLREDISGSGPEARSKLFELTWPHAKRP